MPNLFVFGASGHAKVVIDIVERRGEYEIIGIIDRDLGLGEKFCGYPVVGRDEDLAELSYKYSCRAGVIAVGDNSLRQDIYKRLANVEDFFFPVISHPSVEFGRDVIVDQGAVLMAGVIVNSAVEISEFALLNTRSSVDHDCRIGAFASLAPGVCLGGGVAVGDMCSLGIGALVLPGCKLGRFSTLGAASLLRKDLPERVIAYGIPAEIKRSLEVENDK